jgi:glycosyltransferase involved in cell wall biosynthesis
MDALSMDHAPRKLLYIFDHADWKSRMPVALGARAEGYDVRLGIVGPSIPDHPMFKDFDIVLINEPKHKFGPLSVLKTVLSLRRLIYSARPDILHTITLKYAFTVGLACLGLRGFHRVYTIAGLGYLFHGDGLKPRLIRAALSPFLKLVLKNPRAHIIFQNDDDRQCLIKKNYVRGEHTHLVISSGVDLSRFVVEPEPDTPSPLVLMPTRLVREKGVAVFAEAARIVRSSGTKAIFQIAGGLTTHNPKALTQQDMDEITRDSAVEWLGQVADMPALLARANLIVYPSYYGEGVPRVLIESCAAGRAIITTDHTGCREAVDHGVNGLLVTVRDPQATAEAILSLLNDPERRKSMGAMSRKLAEQKFALDLIVRQTLSVYDIARKNSRIQ